MSFTSPRRRTVLGAAALTAASATGLTACGGSGSGGSAGKGGAEASAKLKLPDFVPAKTPEPDLAGNENGLEPAYLTYPEDLVRSVPKPPGDGKTVTALTETWTTPMPAYGANAYLQSLNKRLGSKLDMTVVTDTGDGYLGKFNAVIASGDIPDLVWFPPNQGLTRVPELLQAKFHDLTDRLSGDGVKKYPNLANLSTFSWRTGAVVNGRLAGTVLTSGRLGQAYIANRDFWKPVGGLEFDSAQDFLEKAKDLLDKKRKKYVLEPFYVNSVHMFGEWHGAPCTWRDTGGKLQHMFESDEYFAAIEFARKCYEAGLYWPDANLTTVAEKMVNGQLGAYVDATPNGMANANAVLYDADVIIPFAATKDSKPQFDFNRGSVGFTAIANSVPEKRIDALLGILDYLAAPMGSEERLFLEFGEEGVHHTRDKRGDVVLNEKGEAQVLTTVSPVGMLAKGPATIYVAGEPERARRLHERQKTLIGMGEANAALGHYSDTDTDKGASLTSTTYDLVNEVVAGRKPLSAWKDAVKKWRSGGGDRIRGEYEKSIAAS